MKSDDVKALTDAQKERFWSRVAVAGPNECWLWTGATRGGGYGVLQANCVTFTAHRLAYELLRGPIPDGLTLDHLCRNKACVNPAHLDPVALRENILRSDGVTAVNARKTHCVNGHLLAGDNLYRHPRGDRVCRACGRDRAREAYQRAKADAALAAIGREESK